MVSIQDFRQYNEREFNLIPEDIRNTIDIDDIPYIEATEDNSFFVNESACFYSNGGLAVSYSGNHLSEISFTNSKCYEGTLWGLPSEDTIIGILPEQVYPELYTYVWKNTLRSPDPGVGVAGISERIAEYNASEAQIQGLPEQTQPVPFGVESYMLLPALIGLAGLRWWRRQRRNA
jgi:hypothetical protein